MENRRMIELFWQDLGTKPYREVWETQEDLRKRILEGDSDSLRLLIVEHPPTISLGRAEKGANLFFDQHTLISKGFDVVESNRGGKVTYHGPGQLVAYPVIDLRQIKMGVKQYVNALEEVMIQTTKEYQLSTDRRDGCPGLWFNGKKMGSIGIHVRKQVSIHGLSLNISPNLEHFNVMTPCGLSNVQMTSMQKEGVETSWKAVVDTFISAFAAVFNMSLFELPKESQANQPETSEGLHV